MESAQGEVENSGASALKKWGPLGLLVVAAVVVIIIVASGGGGDDDSASDSSSSSAQSSQAETAEEDATTEEGSSTNESAETETAEEAAPATEDCPTAADARDDLLPGVMFYEEAVTRCIADDIEWGDRCDEETGLLKLPTSIPPACFAPFEGDNGGATERGVTEDTINIVYWRWMDTYLPSYLF